MADTPIPPPCAADIYKNGNMVMMTHSIPSAKMEEWVKKVAEKSEQPVDWHFAGGRACILALGDLDKVYAAIEGLLPEHNELQKAGYAEVMTFTEERPFKPSYELYGKSEISTGALDNA